MEYGILGLVVLVLDIIALLGIWKSGLSGGAKILWTIIVLVLPLLGMILWFLIGKKNAL